MRADIIAEARRWLGTPFQHQGRMRGVGCDCLGLVAGVALALGYIDQQPPADYGRRPDGRRLAAALDTYLTCKQGAPEPGDIVLMTWRINPMHVAIVGDSVSPFSLIHAASEFGRVVEHGADANWQRRILAVYEFKGVAPWPS